MEDVVAIKRALISVYDKSGLTGFLQLLNPKGRDIELISSGGTAKEIAKLGYTVMDAGTYTGYPESPGGLVKTLQPKIHGGILLDPSQPDHKAYMDKQGIPPIDLVVVNLYPFQEVVNSGADFEKIRENIDIGGPTMVRAAAKNFKRVAVLVNWKDASAVASKGSTTLADRVRLMQHAFEHTRDYENAIDAFMYKQVPEVVAQKYLGGL
ncbi:MAG TPA: IMP cyclohydrolase [Candidatus Binatia bacterium]|nr:IMP cyclohydrolase [Candidatus Binatia bacterium]